MDILTFDPGLVIYHHAVWRHLKKYWRFFMTDASSDWNFPLKMSGADLKRTAGCELFSILRMTSVFWMLIFWKHFSNQIGQLNTIPPLSLGRSVQLHFQEQAGNWKHNEVSSPRCWRWIQIARLTVPSRLRSGSHLFCLPQTRFRFDRL